MQRTEGEAGYASTAEKKRTGFLWAVFSVSLKISVFYFIFISLSFNFFIILVDFMYLFSSLDTING